MKRICVRIPDIDDPYQQYYIKYYPKCGNYYLMCVYCNKRPCKRWHRTSLHELCCTFGFFRIAKALNLTFNRLYIRYLKGCRGNERDYFCRRSEKNR